MISQASKDCLGHLVGSWTCVLNEHLNEKVFKKLYSVIPQIIHLQKGKKCAFKWKGLAVTILSDHLSGHQQWGNLTLCSPIDVLRDALHS